MSMGPLRHVLLVTLAVAACGDRKPNSDDGDLPDSAPTEPDACNDGLSCFVVDCASKGLPPTTVSGTIYAPNGTLPLYGVTVYVPFVDPGPLADGVQCGNCAAGVPGGAVTQVTTDEMGHFSLENVPATDNVPIVVQVGKWRKQLTLPTVAACQDLPLDTVQTTLPKSKLEGDIPKIAVTTGDADALECLIRKLGIDDTEFTTDAGDGRVHLYDGDGTESFQAGGTFPSATTLWASTAKLSAYDIVVFSCEGSQVPNADGGTEKPQAALEAVRDYANAGGRLFMSHWHNIWVGGEVGNPSHGIPEWESIGTWNFGAPQDMDNNIAVIDETVPKGTSFAEWMQFVGGSPTAYGEVPITGGARYTLTTNDIAKSDRRVHIPDPAPYQSVQDLEFSTPAGTPEEVPLDQRCGKVVFSDMHVSAGSSSRADRPFPTGCSNTDLTPQEKALAFLFFDISSCVGVIP